jgi:hypothetical protein
VEPMADQVTNQYQFRSDGQTVTVEITDDGNLVFIDHDLAYDIGSIEFGYKPTTAALLSELWGNSNPGFVFNACLEDSTFKAFNRYNRLENIEARIILSYSLEPYDRGAVASSGVGFTIDQRIQMATYKDSSESVMTFLVHYEPSTARITKPDLTPQKRRELYKYLTPEDKWQVVLHAVYLDDSERFSLILECGNDAKLEALRHRPVIMKHKREMYLLNSIDDDETLARALCFVRLIKGQDFKDQAHRVRDRKWFMHVVEYANEPEARLLRYELYEADR